MTGVQTCALPICLDAAITVAEDPKLGFVAEVAIASDADRETAASALDAFPIPWRPRAGR